MLSETVEVNRVAAVNNEEVGPRPFAFLRRIPLPEAPAACEGLTNRAPTVQRSTSCAWPLRRRALDGLRFTQVQALQEQVKKLQEELNNVYKEKASLAQEVLGATKQLQIVRENFEQHDKTLTERSNTIKELKASKKDLSCQIDHLKAAHAETAKELEVGNKTILQSFRFSLLYTLATISWNSHSHKLPFRELCKPPCHALNGRLPVMEQARWQQSGSSGLHHNATPAGAWSNSKFHALEQ